MTGAAKKETVVSGLIITTYYAKNKNLPAKARLEKL